MISRRHVFLPTKSTTFWRRKSLFLTPEPSPSWSVIRAKTLGTKIPPVRHVDFFSGGPRLPPEVVSACLNFLTRGPKNLLLHGKNQAGRAPHYWPACQKFRSTVPKMTVIVIIKGYAILQLTSKQESFKCVQFDLGWWLCENISQHLLCRAICNLNFTILQYLTQEVMPDVNVLRPLSTDWVLTEIFAPRLSP